MDVKHFMQLWKDFKAKVEDEDEDEEETKSAFRAYDINGDGYITKDEMVQVRVICLPAADLVYVNMLRAQCCVPTANGNGAGTRNSRQFFPSYSLHPEFQTHPRFAATRGGGVTESQ